MRPAVEEMLRFDGPISLTQVFPVAGATLMGRPADANMPYIGLLTAANHDPEAFEEPDRFLITRERKPIQTFGGGPHFCLGMNLARLELQMVFHALVVALSEDAIARGAHRLGSRPFSNRAIHGYRCC